MALQRRSLLLTMSRGAMLAAALLAAASTAQALTFNVTDLSQYTTGTGLTTMGISPNGQYVTGMVSQDGWHAYRYQVGQGAISLIAVDGMKENQGNGVNDAGQVAGFYKADTIQPGFTGYPFIASPGGSTIFPATNSGSVKLNNGGQIAGYGEYEDEYQNGHTYLLYYDSTVHNLGFVDASPMVGGINDNAWIAGVADHVTGRQAFVNKPGGDGRQTVWLDFGDMSAANGISSDGTVVGVGVNSEGQQRGLVSYVQGDGYSAPIALSTLLGGSSSYSIAEGINDNGWIVGRSDGAGFLAVNNGDHYVTQDLTAMLTGTGWTITDAYGVANNGTILATAVYDGMSQPVPVLLTVSVVPEPSTLAMLGAAVAASLAFCRWRTRRGR